MSDLHVNTGRFERQLFNGFCSEIGQNIEFLLFRSLANAAFYGGSSQDVSWNAMFGASVSSTST